jgi:hypothetical protein
MIATPEPHVVGKIRAVCSPTTVYQAVAFDIQQ